MSAAFERLRKLESNFMFFLENVTMNENRRHFRKTGVTKDKYQIPFISLVESQKLGYISDLY